MLEFDAFLPLLREGRLSGHLYYRLRDTAETLSGRLDSGPDLARHLASLPPSARNGLSVGDFAAWLSEQTAAWPKVSSTRQIDRAHRHADAPPRGDRERDPQRPERGRGLPDFPRRPAPPLPMSTIRWGRSYSGFARRVLRRVHDRIPGRPRRASCTARKVSSATIRRLTRARPAHAPHRETRSISRDHAGTHHRPDREHRRAAHVAPAGSAAHTRADGSSRMSAITGSLRRSPWQRHRDRQSRLDGDCASGIAQTRRTPDAGR